MTDKETCEDMFGYRATAPRVRLVTERLIVRLVNERDAWLLADYYTENRHFLSPWEPFRDGSHCTASGWQSRLSFIIDMHRQQSAFYFILLDSDENEIVGIANFSNILRGAFHACYLGYSLGEKWQGKGMMQEALGAAIRYMQQQQRMHRIMANYMPHNQRSGNLLSRLGFEKEGYARDYLLINGKWQDHVLTALTSRLWQPAKLS
ncbi:MAG: Putative ribosomal N-acetyltransferase YdaF [Candidatus Erwinia impunctatus]|nr:Putative ribosomal N-acetyltransferase YdaF [Culicoides impunctatus]